MHTTATDGRADIESMARAARAAGLRYLAITDHSKSLAMANGLDEARALEHARAVREVGARLDGITLLAGIECDIRPDGTMDLADDCLAAARHRRRVAAFGIQPGTGTDDRSAPACARVSVGRCAGTSDRAA